MVLTSFQTNASLKSNLRTRGNKDYCDENTCTYKLVQSISNCAISHVHQNNRKDEDIGLSNNL